jgi:hypothetical protein
MPYRSGMSLFSKIMKSNVRLLNRLRLANWGLRLFKPDIAVDTSGRKMIRPTFEMYRQFSSERSSRGHWLICINGSNPKQEAAAIAA